MKQTLDTFLKSDSRLIQWILSLLLSDFTWLGHILLIGVRFAWRHKPGPKEHGPKEEDEYASGPFVMERRRQMGDLLVWVPRRLESYLIDDLTGGFGYSHITIDTGEVDLPTGKPVMAEVTIGQSVERKFQDEYGDRAYARIPLSKTGVDEQKFVDCVKSRLGEPYDNLEALTLGEIDDPARQMCSSLASDCLPEAVQCEIARARKLRLLHRNSVSVHSRSNATKTGVFISPNGFAEYYGAPKGKKLRRTDFPVDPRPIETSMRGVAKKHGWKAAVILVAAGVLAASYLLRLINHKGQRQF